MISFGQVPVRHDVDVDTCENWYYPKSACLPNVMHGAELYKIGCKAVGTYQIPSTRTKVEITSFLEVGMT